MRAKTGNRSFSREARLAHLSQMGLLARDYSLQGQVIIAAFITPYEESRQALRKSCPGYFEVWIDSSLATCEGRDVKGLYAKARSGEIKSFTGISDVFEEPKSFDLRIKTDDRSVEDSLSDLLRGLNEKRGFSF